MKRTTTMSIGITVMVMLGAAGCDRAAQHAPVAITLKGEKGEPATLQIPRGYIEQPKNFEESTGALPNVLLRIPAKDFSGAEAFVAESEVRVFIEPRAGNADAAEQLQSAALRRSKAAEDAIAKSNELSKPGMIVYTYKNGKEEAEAYFLTSASGDVFVECWKSVCKAYKTWKRRVHVRFDYQPVQTSAIQAADAAIDAKLQSFMGDAK
jgi:hypothetical protein